MSRVWDESPYEHSLLLVHLCLADISNDEGYCWPSVGTIAKKCRLDERYTRKLLNQLVVDGAVEKALNEGKRGTNVYLVRVTPVKKDSLSKKTGGEKRQPVSQDPSPLSPKTPEPSVEPSVVKKAARDYRPQVEGFETQMEELGHLELWQQWLLIRKKKGGVQSDYALWLILKELFRFPARIKEGLERAVRSNWTGFEWTWVDSSRNGNSHNGNSDRPKPAPSIRLV